MRIAIVGAGMAGLACADVLVAAGHAVTLLDKARGPGGRMSTRRIDTPLGQVSFDHGAQYFTAREPAFQQQVAGWLAEGVVARWTLAAADAWVGTPGMSAVIKAMARNHDIHWTTQIERIEKQSDGWLVAAGATAFEGFDAVLLAVPAEQSVPFLATQDRAMAEVAQQVRTQPCWTGLFAFATPVPGDRDLVRKTGAIGWAARNSAKSGKSGPEGWVVQATPEWSEAHLEDDAATVQALLLAELSAVLREDLPAPIMASAHRWRYAMSPGLGHGALWNPQVQLGVCGDWLLGPRVECAWLSGRQLAARVLG